MRTRSPIPVILINFDENWIFLSLSQPLTMKVSQVDELILIPQVLVFPWERLELLELELILEEFQFSINNEFDNSRVSNDSTKAKRENI